MHSERGEISQRAADELNATRTSGGRLIAVGTTVARLLETAVHSAAALGTSPAPAAGVAIPAWRGETNLFIRPPFEFLAVDALMTNFHFPRTTLLVLVQTFGGPELIAEAYRQAIRDEYRFYSYGDAMLIV
jgi:S-adenosylmethionine:tRNA ribosyltransferase-isomerase